MIPIPIPIPASFDSDSDSGIIYNSDLNFTNNAPWCNGWRGHEFESRSWQIFKWHIVGEYIALTGCRILIRVDSNVNQ